jgi:hypothetical protein
MTLMGIIFAWAIRSRKFLDLIPVARELDLAIRDTEL